MLGLQENEQESFLGV